MPDALSRDGGCYTKPWRLEFAEPEPLAAAHARAGDPVTLSAYMGDDSEFDKAIAEFAMAYADQTEHDWSAFLNAIKAGRISAEEQHVAST
jgi:predicted alpha/beta hydrolase